MAKKTINLVMAAAVDSGNGFSKTYFQFEDGSSNTSVTPSIYATISSNENIPELEEVTLENVNTNMDVIIKSPALKTTSEYLVGQAAINSGNYLMDYNVEASRGKSTPDISVIIPLAKIAYAALAHYVEHTHSIPTTINVALSYYMTCLPISEFRNPKNRELFKKRFCKGKHLITIKNFEKDVKVNITFSSNTFIYPEGITAQIGLIYDPTDSRFYRQGNLYQDTPYKDGKAYHDSGNVLLIDIGDGTTDISIMNATHPLNGLGVNISLNQGVGTAAASASEQLAIDYPQLHYTRSIFLEHVSRQDSEGKTLRKKYLEPQLDLLMSAIEKEVEKEFSKTNNDINTVVVLGGGVNLLTDNNKKTLQDLLNDLNPFETHQKIWWVPSKYNQLLNLDGLRVFLSRKLNQN